MNINHKYEKMFSKIYELYKWMKIVNQNQRYCITDNRNHGINLHRFQILKNELNKSFFSIFYINIKKKLALLIKYINN